MTRQWWIVPALMGLAICLPHEGPGQDPAREDSPSSVSEEEILELVDDDEPVEEIAELISWLRENPVDVNSAGREDLLGLPGVSPDEADAILRLRDTRGKLASVNEILDIPGGKALLSRVRPYVFVQPQRTGPVRRHQPALILSTRLTESSPGAVATSGEQMLGTPTRVLSRLTAKPSDHVTAGVVLEKDAGERARDGFASGYISLHRIGVIEQVVLGDYTAGAAQGLVLWRGTDFGRNGDVVGGVRKSESRVQPYHMADEAHYLRGGAIILKSRISSVPLRCMLFLSRTALAANVNEDGQVTSFSSGGLYRTEKELEKRNSVHETLAGARVECGLRRRATVGLTYYASTFDRNVQPTSGFGFSGGKAKAVGVDFTARLGATEIFGEIARTGAGSTAWTGGVVLTLDSACRVSFSCRNYPADFTNPHARGFGAQGSTRNESGMYVGWSLRLSPGFAARGYADQSKFPGSSYGNLLPRCSTDYFIGITALPATPLQLSLSVRMRRLETMQSGVQRDRRRITARVSGRLQLSRDVSARTRIEHAWYRAHVVDPFQKGAMASQTLCVEGRGFSCEYGVTFIEADSYDTRVYDCEASLRGSITSPPLYGKGLRWHLLAVWSSFPWVRLAGKYAVTFREKNEDARELAIQAEIRF